MSDTIEMSVTIVRETAKAFLVDDGDEWWIPKSQITDPEQFDADANDVVIIEISEWWADKAGLL